MGLSFTSRGLRTDELTVNNDLMQPAPPIAVREPLTRRACRSLLRSR